MNSEPAGAVREGLWRDFLTVAFRPIRTMERVLARQRRPVIPLLLLAALSNSIKPGSVEGFRSSSVVLTPWMRALVPVGLLVGCVVLVLLFYGLAWVIRTIGAFLEGDGEPRDVRAALAWGLAPVIWALLYRIPAALYSDVFTPVRAQVGHARLIIPNVVAAGCGMALILLALELLVLTWTVVTTCGTLSVALKLSPLRALGTLLLTMIIPFVVILAAALALRR